MSCDTKSKKKASYTEYHSVVKQSNHLDSFVNSKSKKYKSRSNRFNKQKSNTVANNNNINNSIGGSTNSNINNNINNINNNINRFNDNNNNNNSNSNNNNNIDNNINITNFTKSKKKELKKVEINSGDLVCLCGPFNLPDDNNKESFTLNNNRYNEDVDLSVIYGSLKADEAPVNKLTYNYDYNFLNKQKLAVNFVNLIELFNDPIESDTEEKCVEASDSMSNSIANSILDSKSTSNSDSNSNSNSNSNSASGSETDSEFQSDYEIDEIDKINNDAFVSTATVLLRDVFEHDHKDKIYSFDNEQIGIKIAK